MSEHEPFGFGDDGLGGHEPGFGHDPFDADHGFHDSGLDDGLGDGLGGGGLDHDSFDHGDLGHDGYGHDYTEAEEPTDPHTETELPETLAEPAGTDHLVTDDDTYPPHLDLAAVTVSPTDGQEWVDPGLLGDEHADFDSDQGGTASPEELLNSLHDADGSEGEPSWDAALNSDDPAVRSLAAFWHPGN